MSENEHDIKEQMERAKQAKSTLISIPFVSAPATQQSVISERRRRHFPTNDDDAILCLNSQPLSFIWLRIIRIWLYSFRMHNAIHNFDSTNNAFVHFNMFTIILWQLWLWHPKNNLMKQILKNEN